MGPNLRGHWQYVEQRDWLTVEQVWQHVREHFDSGYTVERCEDDLRALVGWQSLMAEQDRSRVSTLDEWHHRRQVYHITAVTIELEAALERLRAAHGRCGSPDSSLIEMLLADLAGLDRLFADGVAASPGKELVATRVRRPWLDAYGPHLVRSFESASPGSPRRLAKDIVHHTRSRHLPGTRP